MGSTPLTSDVVRTLRAAVNASIGEVGPGLYGVGCSGGVDSMALADAVIAGAGAPHVVIVTVDHGLQPASAEVAAGVAAWAREQGATAIVRRVDVRSRRGSLEAAARTARFDAFDEVIEQLGLVALLLAHTQRDQAETVLMRIVRGTGPAGLAGMAARRGPFVRPWLAVSRADTEAYVQARGLAVWDDPMNRDPAITRVRVRNSLLPAVRSENPAADEALVRLAAATREWLDVIDAQAAPFGRFPIDCTALAAAPPAIRKRALALALDRADIAYDASHLDAIDRLVVASERGEVSLDVPGARVTRSYARLDVHRAPVPAIDLGTTRYVAPDGPYEIRTWQTGDRMCPARLRGRSRKLSDLFIDLKIPRGQRALAHVLVRTTDRAIVWAEHVGIAYGFSTDLAPLPR
ncbi:MAG: tRNA lysidine(34) synthetase TilS [Deltaproteobacteria bacterium]